LAASHVLPVGTGSEQVISVSPHPLNSQEPSGGQSGCVEKTAMCTANMKEILRIKCPQIPDLFFQRQRVIEF
jgi:hypothetical protein